MKFGHLVEICFWLNLTVKGLSRSVLVLGSVLALRPNQERTMGDSGGSIPSDKDGGGGVIQTLR